MDNLQEYVEDHLTEVEDFEANFRMLSTRERDAGKLPDEKRFVWSRGGAGHLPWFRV